MKKHTQPHHLFLALLAFAALVLTSCKGLASPRTETSSFSFKVTDEMIAAISRAAISDSTICTITVHLYSADGTSYDATQTKTDSLAALKNYIFAPFTGIPFGLELNLTVEVKAGGELLYDSGIQTFTLEKDNATQTLTVQMKRVKPAQNTPFVLAIEGQTDPVFILLPADTAFEAETSSLAGITGKTSAKAGILENSFYCCDANNTVWCVDRPEDDYLLYVTDSSGTTKEVTINADINEFLGVDGITYDPVYNKLYMICDIWIQPDGEEDGYETYYVKSFEPEEYLTWGETLSLKKHDLLQLYIDSYEQYDGMYYAYNGFLYTLYNNEYDMQYTKDAAIAPITKISLSDGKLVKEGTVSIPRVNPLEGATVTNGEITNDNYINGVTTSNGERTSYDSCRFIFNDMVVIDDSVYIPVSQKEIWADGYSTSDQEGITFSGTPNGGYVRRGGIIVLDAETLEQKKTLGMAPVQEKLDLPLTANITWRKTDSYATLSTDMVLYKDREYSVPFMYSTPISFAMSELNKNTINFSNPLKIVAIKPKKLVVLDQGLVYWVEDDKDENGKPVVKECTTLQNQYFHATPVRRLITVDLENFANSKITTLFTDATEDFSYTDVINEDTSNSTSYPSIINYTYELNTTPGTVYHPELYFTASQYTDENNNTAYPIEEFHQTGNVMEYNGSCVSDFSISTKIQLPF